MPRTNGARDRDAAVLSLLDLEGATEPPAAVLDSTFLSRMRRKAQVTRHTSYTLITMTYRGTELTVRLYGDDIRNGEILAFEAEVEHPDTPAAVGAHLTANNRPPGPDELFDALDSSGAAKPGWLPEGVTFVPLAVEYTLTPEQVLGLGGNRPGLGWLAVLSAAIDAVRRPAR